MRLKMQVRKSLVYTEYGGQWGTQVRKTQVRYRRGGKRKYGKFKQESARVDMLLFVSNVSTYRLYSLQPILTVSSVEVKG